MTTLRPYPEYKLSGIDWLGDIPANWAVRKTGHCFQVIGSGTTPQSGNALYHANGSVPWVNTGDLNDGLLHAPSKMITERTLSEYPALRVFPAGALIVAMYGATIGKTGISRFDATVNQACCVLANPTIVTTRFAQLAFIGLKPALVNLAVGGGQPNISQETVRQFQVPVPPLPEQQAIADFLDVADARISRYIAAKRRMISLLEEQKQAIINQAVTRGLDPDVPLKPSGVEWLGDIPAHWEVFPLKRWLETPITDGPHETPEWQDEGIDFVSAESMVNGRIDFDKRRGFISEVLHQTYCKKVHPRRDDIFMCKSGATTGKLAMVDTDREFSVWSPLALIRADTARVFPYFLFSALHSTYLQLQVQQTWSYGTQPNLSMLAMSRLLVALPPLDEQQGVQDFIRSESAQLELILNRVRQEMQLIQEYRTRLISDVVTGKLDVRGVELPALEDLVDSGVENALEDIVDAHLDAVGSDLLPDDELGEIDPDV